MKQISVSRSFILLETVKDADLKRFTSSWRHRRFGHVDQWSWCADLGLGASSSVEDLGGIGSKVVDEKSEQDVTPVN